MGVLLLTHAEVCPYPQLLLEQTQFHPGSMARGTPGHLLCQEGQLTSKDCKQVPGQGLSGRGVAALAGQVVQRQDGFIHQARAVGLELIWTHRATVQGSGS